MPHARYAIIPHGDQWMINIDGKNYGPYSTQSAALRDAVDTAQKAGVDGFDAQVLVQAADGRFLVEWTYGKDGYPPVV